MRVSVEQSGGFTGIPFTASVDAETLSAEEAMRLRELVEAAEFFQLPKKIPGPVCPDQVARQVKGGRLTEPGQEGWLLARGGYPFIAFRFPHCPGSCWT